jgi:hypothetical protein
LRRRGGGDRGARRRRRGNRSGEDDAGGGNCRYSGGFLFDLTGPDAIRYPSTAAA